MSKDTGGAAFPELAKSFMDRRDDSTMYESTGGMTLRDYFAAKAMQGFCANNSHSAVDGPQEFKFAANEAYKMADSMLAERAK